MQIVNNKKQYIILAIIIIVATASIIIAGILHSDKERAGDRNISIETMGVISAMRQFLLDDLDIEYNDAEMKNNIIASVSPAKGELFCLVRFSYQQSEYTNSKVDVVKVICVKSQNDNCVIEAFTPSYILDPADYETIQDLPPYIQVTMEPIEKRFYFIAAKIYDTTYHAYFEGKELTSATGNIVGLCLESDIQPSESVLTIIRD
ncbi:MAG: hypothetical protein LBS85_05400 [Clostridiales Family XIII bacterium]|jgi:hypothetical protein|nr:hypothetical protein [Clostridiales Family XIII bacterium]